MTEEQLVELSATIAGAWLEDIHDFNARLDSPWTLDKNGDKIFTEDAQDWFNEIFDRVQNIMHDTVEIERKDR
tara:strand:+ start:2455 stop:2673 length:219 start_codon:yes stop_codon:yes gene_type:complete